VTTVDELNQNIMILWNEPDNNGSPITSYTVLIRGSDPNFFATDLNNCDGSDSTIIDTT
jgi:hypothetical protein